MTLRFAMKSAKKLLPVVRYYSYIEITRRAHQTLWREYEHLQSTFDNFAMQHIRDQMIFIRCSVNCFINKMQQLKAKTISGHYPLADFSLL